MELVKVMDCKNYVTTEQNKQQRQSDGRATGSGIELLKEPGELMVGWKWAWWRSKNKWKGMKRASEKGQN